jgi:hypothetical protein
MDEKVIEYEIKNNNDAKGEQDYSPKRNRDKNYKPQPG